MLIRALPHHCLVQKYLFEVKFWVKGGCSNLFEISNLQTNKRKFKTLCNTSKSSRSCSPYLLFIPFWNKSKELRQIHSVVSSPISAVKAINFKIEQLKCYSSIVWIAHSAKQPKICHVLKWKVLLTKMKWFHSVSSFHYLVHTHLPDYLFQCKLWEKMNKIASEAKLQTITLSRSHCLSRSRTLLLTRCLWHRWQNHLSFIYLPML